MDPRLKHAGKTSKTTAVEIYDGSLTESFRDDDLNHSPQKHKVNSNKPWIPDSIIRG